MMKPIIAIALAASLATAPAQARWNGGGPGWHGGGGWRGGGWHHHGGAPVWPWALGAFGLGVLGGALASPYYYPPPPYYAPGYFYPSPYPPPPPYGYYGQ